MINEKEKFQVKMFDRNGKGYIKLVKLQADSKKWKICQLNFYFPVRVYMSRTEERLNLTRGNFSR